MKKISVLFSLFLLLAIVCGCSYNSEEAQETSTLLSPEDSQVALELQTTDNPEPLIVEPGAIKRLEMDAYEAGEEDLQNPEYPTGCEGVSAAVMLRMNGIDVTNDKFMEALPQGGGEDFVHAYWGDPSTHAGFACMAPAITETCKKLIPSDFTVLDITGTPLTYLPAPCVVWTTMYFSDPVSTEYEQEGYHLFYNTHCVVLLSCDDHQAHVWDPLQGYQDVAFSQFNEIYNTLGRQAVYVVPREYGTEEKGSGMDDQERKEEFEALMQQVEDGAYDGDGPEDVAPVSVDEEGEADGE